FNISEDIIFSIINVESHFNTEAVSQKGAVGLMQIMPSTAKEMARKLKMEDFDLKISKDNIMLGTCYIAELFSEFQDFDNAFLAYNAGPANVKSWLSDERYSQDGKAVTNVPFSETRNYLTKIRENLKYYKTKV
ncbi:MAG: lytic transglycosylase domain-containing protein, partial [Clostridia bacterium]|nr:lytic transglycosylase domain-containing protein [Clostridia bacterium]